MARSTASLLVWLIAACDAPQPATRFASDKHAAPAPVDARVATTLIVEGIAMPPGANEIYREDAPGFHDDSRSLRWLLARQPPDEVVRHFRGLGTGSGSGSEIHFGPWRVRVTPASEIPRTTIVPVRPVVANLPAGFASWIIVDRYSPPPPCPPCPAGTQQRSSSVCRCG